MLENNFSEICRCCMKNGDINMFFTFYESKPISEILEQIVSKQISSEDLLPKTICAECLNIIVSQFLFLTNYNRVQDQFLRILKEQHDIGDEMLKETQSNTPPTSHLNNYEITFEYQTTTNMANSSISKDSDKEQNECHSIGNSCFDSDEECIIISQSQDSSYEEPNDSFENSQNDETKPSSSNQDKNGKVKSEHFCVDCNESFEFLYQLNSHCKVKKHTPLRRYTCKICLKEFSRSTNLKRHEETHTYFCESCGKGFMGVHDGNTPYICELCREGFHSNSLLHQHMNKYDDKERHSLKDKNRYYKYGKKLVQCKVCQKTLTKHALYNHMTRSHGDGSKKFLCNLCGKTYTRKDTLKAHMNTHTKEIKYDCDICGKSFLHREYLNIHLLRHSGEKPHCCELCGKTFYQRSQLWLHKFTHTGEKPYSCTYCNKSFSLKGNLKIHSRVHTKEKPYCCTICGKAYFDKTGKTKHEFKVHQIQQQ